MQLIRVSKTYDSGEKSLNILKNVNANFAAGSVYAIIGKSGSGKTSLLSMLAGLDAPTSGSIILEGHEISAYSAVKMQKIISEKFGFVYQFHHLLGDFSVFENLLIPQMITATSQEVRAKNAEYWLKQVGVELRAHHYPNQISGGERARVAIARAFVNNPEVIFMDEPTGNLDTETSEDIQKLIKKLAKKFSKTFIIATHDRDFAADCDKLFVIHQKQLKQIDNKAIKSFFDKQKSPVKKAEASTGKKPTQKKNDMNYE